MASYLNTYYPALQIQAPDMSEGLGALAGGIDKRRDNQLQDEKLNLLKRAQEMKEAEFAQTQQTNQLGMAEKVGKWAYTVGGMATTPEMWERMRTTYQPFAQQYGLPDLPDFGEREDFLTEGAERFGVADAGLEREKTRAEIAKTKAETDKIRAKMAGGDLADLSVTEKKEIFNSENELANLDVSVETLNKAQLLNDKAFSGYTAGLRGELGAKLPDAVVPDFLADKAGAEATLEWRKIMDLEAIKAMANTLKGVTTDFELREFQTVLSDPETPPAIRKRIIDRMLKLSELKRDILQSRVEGLRGRTYFSPGQSVPRAKNEQVISDPLAEARSAIERGAPREAVIERLQQMGIDPAGL